MEVHSFKTRRFQLGTRLGTLILQGQIDFAQCRNKHSKAQLGELSQTGSRPEVSLKMLLKIHLVPFKQLPV